MLDGVKEETRQSWGGGGVWWGWRLIFQPYCSDQRALAEVWPHESSRGPDARPPLPRSLALLLIRGDLRPRHLALRSRLGFTRSFSLPTAARPPFSPAGRPLCLGSSGLPATSVSALPSLPSPKPLLQTPALYVFYGCC